jgi:hypothetical protein
MSVTESPLSKLTARAAGCDDEEAIFSLLGAGSNRGKFARRRVKARGARDSNADGVVERSFSLSTD